MFEAIPNEPVVVAAQSGGAVADIALDHRTEPPTVAEKAGFATRSWHILGVLSALMGFASIEVQAYASAASFAPTTSHNTNDLAC